MNIQEERDFINELRNEVHQDIADWAQSLFEEGMTIVEIKNAMRRMMAIAERS